MPFIRSVEKGPQITLLDVQNAFLFELQNPTTNQDPEAPIIEAIYDRCHDIYRVIVTWDHRPYTATFDEMHKMLQGAWKKAFGPADWTKVASVKFYTKAERAAVRAEEDATCR